MIVNAIDKKIRKAFSSSAMQYEMLTGLHKEIGRELVEKIHSYDPSVVLDVGMGTGGYTKRLTNIFPDAAVIGLDFASGMIDQAQDEEETYHIVQANASQLPFKDGTFDIITSNLAYQWISDLTQAFELCHQQLNESGIIAFTMFGFDTFKELFNALDVCVNKKEQKEKSIIGRLANEKQVEEALKQAGFKNICVSSEQIKVRFQSMMDLVKWVKDIGANALPKDFYMGKDLLFKTNDYYNAHFKDRLGVYATFEVIWAEAKR